MCEGERSLPSCLGGGDLDGYVLLASTKHVQLSNGKQYSDEYNVSVFSSLLTPQKNEPAEYNSLPPREIDDKELKDPMTGAIDPERVTPYICDFVVEYINSDVLVRTIPIIIHLKGGPKHSTLQGLLSANHLVMAGMCIFVGH